MLNADLITSVQDGQTDLMGELWERYRRYAAWYARRWLTLAAAAGLTKDDLQQESFCALVEAVNTTSTGAIGFLSWYRFALQRRFATIAKQRTAAGRNEPLNNAVSLDVPVSDEEDSATLADSIPDDTAIAALPETERTVIILRYWQDKTFEQIGKTIGTSKQAASQREQTALRHLREKLRIPDFPL